MRIIPRIAPAPSRRFRISPPHLANGEPPLAAGSQHYQHNRQPQHDDQQQQKQHASLRPRSLQHQSILPRDSLQDQNVMIGVIVGVLLLLFLAALIYFLHRYHGSIRFSRRKKSRRYHHGHGHHGHGRYGSESSKGSHTESDLGGMGAPPPPPAV